MAQIESRSDQLRRRHRRILVWSVGIAALVHFAVFALSPTFSRTVTDGPSTRVQAVGQDVSEAIWIDVRFGPPSIFLRDGEVRQEPPERFLEARGVDVRGIPIEIGCESMAIGEMGTVVGAVRLLVGTDGRVFDARLRETFGNRCTDALLVAVAGTLWYHWLPNEYASAPVELIQPMAAQPVSGVSR